METSHNIIWFIIGVLTLLVIILNLRELKQNKWNSILCIVKFPVLVALIALMLIVFIFFGIFRQIIRMVIKIKYGSKFIDLFYNFDVFHSAFDLRDSVMITLLIVEVTPEKTWKTVLKIFREMAEKNFMQNKMHVPKLFCRLNTFMGYTFMEKSDICIDECVKEFSYSNGNNGKITKTEFLEILSEYYHKPLPRNGGILWDILVGTHSINWKGENENSSTKYYPVLLRFHHAIGDGLVTLKLLWGTIGDVQFSATSVQDYSKPKTPMLRKLLIQFIKMLYVLILLPATLCRNLETKRCDGNIWKGNSYSSREILSVRNEDERESYFQKVKNIKKLSGFSVSEILLTAFSASLNDYFQKNSSKYLKQLPIVLPIAPNYYELSKIVHGRTDIRDINFINNYVVIILNLPICIEKENGFDNKTPLFSRLKLVNKQTENLKNSVEIEVNYLLLHMFFGVLPSWLIRSICNYRNVEIGMSFLPGSSTLTFQQGSLTVSDVNCWSPHLTTCGFNFFVFTYNGRLEISVNAKPSYISNQENAQHLIDNTFKYIDLLEAEVNSLGNIDT